MSLLAARGLAVVRGGRLLLEGLDLDVAADAAVQVVGPNGAGKSSLLRCLAGLLTPAAGRVVRTGAVALSDDRLPLDPELSLERALRFWLPFCHAGPGLGEALLELALDGVAHVPVRMLSSGQRKRASLLLVRLSGAPVWLLDEPLNALDSDGMALLDRMVAAHRERGGAVVAASHQPLGDGWHELRLGA